MTVLATCSGEIEKKGNTKERTERESEGRRTNEEWWQTCSCCRDQRRACRLAQASVENFERTGHAVKVRVASAPQSKQ